MNSVFCSNGLFMMFHKKEKETEGLVGVSLPVNSARMLFIR